MKIIRYSKEPCLMVQESLKSLKKQKENTNRLFKILPNSVVVAKVAFVFCSFV